MCCSGICHQPVVVPNVFTSDNIDEPSDGTTSQPSESGFSTVAATVASDGRADQLPEPTVFTSNQHSDLGSLKGLAVAEVEALCSTKCNRNASKAARNKRNVKKKNVPKKTAVRRHMRNKQNSDDSTPCGQCGQLFNASTDDKLDDDWLQCSHCTVWMHESCAEESGIIDDLEFICGKCCD